MRELAPVIGSLEIAPELLDSAEVAGGRRDKYEGYCFFGGMLITAQLNLKIHKAF